MDDKFTGSEDADNDTASHESDASDEEPLVGRRELLLVALFATVRRRFRNKQGCEQACQLIRQHLSDSLLERLADREEQRCREDLLDKESVL